MKLAVRDDTHNHFFVLKKIRNRIIRERAKDSFLGIKKSWESYIKRWGKYNISYTGTQKKYIKNNKEQIFKEIKEIDFDNRVNKELFLTRIRELSVARLKKLNGVKNERI